jgi:2-polyprenyl-3-methyl-5-hydroxy-6-metoxy-1,4-benzoquinol methylase
MPGSAPRSRPCPVCGASSSAPLYRQRFESFARGSIGDGYDVVACNECGMCFATGLPDRQRFAQYYADSSKYDLSAEGAQLSAQDLQRYADQAEFVAAHVAERGMPILDVGTATGDFLQALREKGFERPYGVDPSPDAVRVGRDELGLELAVGGLNAAEAWGLEFGLVSYVAVLEHVLEPREQVRAVTRLLRRDGFVFVSVPDAGTFKDHVDAPYQEFSVEHVNFFSRSSLANAMGAEGYSLVAERVVVLPLGTDGHGPALEAVYRWDGVAQPLQPDPSGPDDMREYISRSGRMEASVLERIASLASSGERIYVWGTGTHTLHLLRTSRLGDCRIEAFLDSNPHYAGATLAGRPVIAPSSLQAADAPILVSSAVSQSGIATAARERFGHDVQLILLH